MAKGKNSKKEKTFLTKLVWRLFGALLITLCLAVIASIFSFDEGDSSYNVAASGDVQNYLGISKEETMAFGDNNNDIGMMLAAGESYAVETAVKEVKAAAGNICPGYLEKGVYQIIKNLI